MNERLRNFIETLFEDAPQTTEAIELKEEMIQNLLEKYDDLVAQGKSSEAAYNIVTASVGNIEDLLSQLKRPEEHPQLQKEVLEAQKRRALFITISVVLYIISVVPILWLQNELGIILMFVFVAIATGFIVYSSLSKPKYLKKDATVVEEFKEWQSKNPKVTKEFNSIKSILWCLIVVIYVIVSFITGAWHITWLIFIIGVAIETIIKAIFEMRE